MELSSISHDKLDEFIEFYKKGYEESFWNRYPFNEISLRQDIEAKIDDKSSFTCICMINGVIIGGFLGDLGKFRHCDALFGMESGIYVDPKYRGSRAAVLMFNEFFLWCKEHNAEPFIEIYYGEDNEKTYKFCKNIGMIECGKVFIGAGHGLPKKSIQ